MRKLLNWLHDSYVQLAQFLLLLLALISSSILNMHSSIDVPCSTGLTLEALFQYLAARCGNIGMGLLFFLLLAMAFHRNNNNKVLNKGNIYHSHTLFWYWLCSKLLGYGSCSLARVPIDMQFRLVLNDTFDSYDMGDISEELKEDECIKKYCYPAVDGGSYFGSSGFVNIVISDTYPIGIESIPADRQNDATIVIKRVSREGSTARRFSIKLVDTVKKTVHELPPGIKLNLFATTNPKNTFFIADSVFKTGGRDNLGALYVYRQQHQGTKDGWAFSKSVKIFDRSSHD